MSILKILIPMGIQLKLPKISILMDLLNSWDFHNYLDSKSHFQRLIISDLLNPPERRHSHSVEALHLISSLKITTFLPFERL